MTSLCTAAVFVNQVQGCWLDNFSEKGGGAARERKRGERAETLSSNSRKWVDLDCVPCVDSMSLQSSGLGEELGN